MRTRARFSSSIRDCSRLETLPGMRSAFLDWVEAAEAVLVRSIPPLPECLALAAEAVERLAAARIIRMARRVRSEEMWRS